MRSEKEIRELLKKFEGYKYWVNEIKNDSIEDFDVGFVRALEWVLEVDQDEE